MINLHISPIFMSPLTSPLPLNLLPIRARHRLKSQVSLAAFWAQVFVREEFRDNELIEGGCKVKHVRFMPGTKK